MLIRPSSEGKKKGLGRVAYVAGADVLLVFDVEVDNLEEQMARLHDELYDLSQRGFVEN